VFLLALFRRLLIRMGCGLGSFLISIGAWPVGLPFSLSLILAPFVSVNCIKIKIRITRARLCPGSSSCTWPRYLQRKTSAHILWLGSVKGPSKEHIFLGALWQLNFPLTHKGGRHFYAGKYYFSSDVEVSFMDFFWTTSSSVKSEEEDILEGYPSH